MRVIAKKSVSYAVFATVCFAVAAIGIIVMAVGISVFLADDKLPSQGAGAFVTIIILPLICTPFGIYFAVKAKLPSALVSLDGERVVLYDGRSFSISDIGDVSYRQDRSKYNYYSFGRLTFLLKNGEQITIRPVAEVESVCKELLCMVLSR